MSNHQDKTPLWCVLDDAWRSTLITSSQSAGTFWYRYRAALIRAVADWLVRSPELERLCERHYLRQILLEEADRAEAGE